MRLSFRIQWSLYVPPGLTFNNSKLCPHGVFICFVWIWEQTAIISLYIINLLVTITETECVYCAVRPGSLYIIEAKLSLWKCGASQCVLLHLFLFFTLIILFFTGFSVKDFCVVREFLFLTIIQMKFTQQLLYRFIEKDGRDLKPL